MPQVNLSLRQPELDLLDELANREGVQRTEVVRRLLQLGREQWGAHLDELEALITEHGEGAELVVTVVDLLAGDPAVATVDGRQVDGLRADAQATPDGRLDLHLAPSWTQRIWIGRVPAVQGVSVTASLASLRAPRSEP